MAYPDPNRPNNSLPDLPPKAELETRAVLKKCINAGTALMELKKSAEMLPNETTLINTLPLLEAQASSEIENIVTTTDRLFQAASLTAEKFDPATKEALKYSKALLEGFQLLSQKPLNTTTAEQICSRIKGVQMTVRSGHGTALAKDGTGEIIYTPPEGEALLRQKLANWEEFLHSDSDINALVKMAVLHYQFEAIHPFTDGNGRTGRILNLLYLVDQKQLRTPILYLSRYIIQNRQAYYDKIQNVTMKGEWEEWVLYMLDAVEKTSNWTTAKVNAILKLHKSLRQFLKYQMPKIYSHELLNQLFKQPYCRIANLVEAGVAERQTASTYLKALSRAGVLSEIKIGREKLFINTRLLSILLTERNDHAPFRDR